MRKYSSLFWYVALFVLVLLTDRATKIFALSGFFSKNIISKRIPFLQFNLLFNRGMSWGIGDSQSNYIFFLISFFIFLVTIMITVYAYRRYEAGHVICGETLVIAGSFSNILDRFLYGGVIDFIEIRLWGWSWPVFNIADVCIVLGVFFMLYSFWVHK